MRPIHPLALALALALLVSATAKTTPPPAPATPHADWAPTPDQQKALARPFKSNDWSIQPPRAARHKTHKRPAETQESWSVEQKGKLTGSLVVTASKGAPNPIPPAQDIERVLQIQRTRVEGFDASPVETGTINGHPFARVRWHAKRVPTLEELDGPVFGFLYVTDAASHPVVIVGVGKADSIPTLEAAAQTFQLSNRRPRGPIAKASSDSQVFR
jgi:hypothetical protein